jgi:hypothetical protein
VAIECRVEGISERTPFRLSDLGLGGGFVDTPAQVEAGARIRVAFSLNGQDLIFPARVAHVQPSIGFGFAFLGDELSDDARRALEQFLAS